MLRTTCFLVFLLLVGGARRGDAALLTIANAGFESPDLSNGASNQADLASAIPGWTITRSTPLTNRLEVGVWDPSTNATTGIPAANPNIPGAGDGQQVGFINSLNNPALVTDIATVSQTLSSTLQGNMSYTLTFAIGAFHSSRPFAGYKIELLAGSHVLASTLSTDVGAPAIPQQNFVDVPLYYDSHFGDPYLGLPLTIQISNLFGSKTTTRYSLLFDNVRLDATPIVPEPSTWILLVCGAALGAGLARSRRLPA